MRWVGLKMGTGQAVICDDERSSAEEERNIVESSDDGINYKGAPR